MELDEQEQKSCQSFEIYSWLFFMVNNLRGKTKDRKIEAAPAFRSELFILDF